MPLASAAEMPIPDGSTADTELHFMALGNSTGISLFIKSTKADSAPGIPARGEIVFWGRLPQDPPAWNQ
jgi:hypothetical protein